VLRLLLRELSHDGLTLSAQEGNTMSAQNPFVYPKRWEDMSFEEHSGPDMVTTMIERNKFKTALEAIAALDPDSPAGRIAREAL
jgi:hypothetical protein